jgi:segregation and condensation protein A
MADDGAGGAAALSPGRPTGDALWDDWDTPPRVPAAPVLHLDGFDGPIDLLLDLAERQQLDLGRISIVDLVDQFVAASMRIAAHVSLERRADWLVMAAHLVLLRSRLLFPASPEAAEDAQRDAARAVARLDALRFIRAAAAWLQARPQLGHDVFARPPPGRDPHVASYMALMEACLTVLRGPDAEPAAAPLYRPPVLGVFRITDILARMRALVAAMTAAQPLETFMPPVPAAQLDVPLVARSAVAATFMAALELCRGAYVGLEQVEPFGPIVVQAIRDAVVSRAATGMSCHPEGRQSVG